MDKTLLIKELLDMKGEVNLFTRPRRFGKTLNLSMLRYFFEAGNYDHARLFKGLKIMDAGSSYLTHMGNYPVISLSLKSMKQPAFELAFDMLKKAIREEFKRHWEEINASKRLSKVDEDRYLRLRDLNGTQSDYADALRFFSECMYTCTGKKTIILIDEYDVPLENANFCGFYHEMTALIRSLFESALKTNDTLEFAVITGCLRILEAPSSPGSKRPRQVSVVGFPTKLEKTPLSGQCQSIFTGLNNLKIMSITSAAYSEHFGFTSQDVETLLKAYGLEKNMPIVKQWYDGYCFGNTEVYNPWSVINYIDSCYHDKNALAKPYWSNTSSNSIVKNLVEHADLSVKQEIETLIESEIIYMEMSIPNSEVRYIKNTVLRWFEEQNQKKALEPLYESILDGDTKTMANILSENLMETISFYDYQENYYHGFLTGLLKGMKNYIVLSNHESGTGRPDIIIKYPSIRGKAIIIEIKVAKNYQELEKNAWRPLPRSTSGTMLLLCSRKGMPIFYYTVWPFTKRIV